MKYPLLLLGTLSLAHGLALYATSYPFVYSAEGSAVFTPTQRQYITQDQLGQYSYGYAEPLSSKQETRTIDGTTRGSYSYRDALGKLQTVQYVADDEGFHVAATNLPKAVIPQEQATFTGRSGSHPVEYNPVEHHSVEHHPVEQHPVEHHPHPHQQTVVETGRSSQPEGHHPVEHHDHSVVGPSASGSHPGHSQLPHPVSDTVEVAAAKSLHLKRVEDETVRNQVLAKIPVARSHHVVVPAPVYGYTIPRYYSSGFYY
ncbi:hypothetical protein KR009_005443 [Drosophila setifemur]|nr:hypothetical protein KR009_005443 [Drosophila setifemur]